MDRSESVESLPPPYHFGNRVFEQYSNNSNTTTISAMSNPFVPVVAFRKSPNGQAEEEDTASVATIMRTIDAECVAEAGSGGGGGKARKWAFYALLLLLVWIGLLGIMVHYTMMTARGIPRDRTNGIDNDGTLGEQLNLTHTALLANCQAQLEEAAKFLEMANHQIVMQSQLDMLDGLQEHLHTDQLVAHLDELDAQHAKENATAQARLQALEAELTRREERIRQLEAQTEKQAKLIKLINQTNYENNATQLYWMMYMHMGTMKHRLQAQDVQLLELQEELEMNQRKLNESMATIEVLEGKVKEKEHNTWPRSQLMDMKPVPEPLIQLPKVPRRKLKAKDQQEKLK